MTDPRSTDDRPQADAPQAATPPVADTAPPLAPEQSPWWSAPSGKPFGIPDFAHEFAARLADILAWLFPAPRPIPVRVTARRRR